jgi:hypothetical protein
MTKRDGPMTPKAEEQISEKISRRLLSGDQPPHFHFIGGAEQR